MANYTALDFAKAQVLLNTAMGGVDERERTPDVFNTFQMSNKMFELKVGKRRDDSVPTEGSYNLRNSRALGVGRSHNHTGLQGDNGVLSLAFATKHDKFSTSLKLADNKTKSSAEIIADELKTVSLNFSTGLEQLAVDHMFNNRSQVNVATVDGTFNAVKFAYEIALANEKEALAISKIVMRINKYAKANLVVFCDSVSFRKFEFYAAQGISNQTNTSFQFSGVTFVHSVEMDAKATGLVYAEGMWCVAPIGTFGVADWIPTQNVIGVETKDYTFTNIIDPTTQLQSAVHSYEVGFDGTATGGFTQDVQTQVEVSVDIAFSDAPISVANESVFQMFALV